MGLRIAVCVFFLFTGFVWGETPAFDWKKGPIDLGLQNESVAWTFSIKDSLINPSKLPTRFEARGLPSWMQLDGATGTLSGTPSRASVGTYDGIELTAISSNRIAVVTAKGEVLIRLQAPRWKAAEIELTAAREGYPYQETLMNHVSNPEGIALQFEAISSSPPPKWLGLGKTTGALFGTPSETSAGELKMRVKVSGTLAGQKYEDAALVRIKIVAENRAPQWKTALLVFPGALSLKPYEQNLESAVTDADGDAISYKILSGPAWLKVASGSGEISGKPSNLDSGKNEWTVEASDPFGAKSAAVLRIVVSKTNEAPRWQAPTFTLPNAREGQEYQADVGQFAKDSDGDTLSFQLLSGPDWIQVGTSGGVLGKPDRDSVGPVKLVVRAEDGKGGNATAEFSFFVEVTQRPPTWILNPIRSRTAEGVAYALDLNPYVSALEPGALSFSIVQTAGWGSLSNQGVFSGKPDARFRGRNSFQFRVLQANGLGATVSVVIEVDEVNRKPVWTVGALPKGTEGVPYQTSVAQFASDTDKLVFSKVGEKPLWVSVSAEGLVTGTPLRKDVGSGTFRVRATDTSGEISEATIPIDVSGTNVPPRWRQKSIALGDLSEQTAFSVNLALYAADDDSDTLTFGLVSGPAWLTVSPSGLVSGVPERKDVGPLKVVFRVRDALSSSDVTAEGVVRLRNTPPVFKKEWPTFQVKEREKLEGNLSLAENLFDAEGDSLSFLLQKLVPWLKLDEKGTFTATPSRAERGVQTIAVSVDDGKDAVVGALRIEVVASPRPPVWLINPIKRLARTNDVLKGSLRAQVQELDGLEVTFAKKSGPDWLALSNDGTFELRPTSSDTGNSRFEVSACNEDGACASGVLDVEVLRGVHSQQISLNDQSAKAKAELVFLLDPSSASKTLVASVKGAFGTLSTLLAKANVEYRCTESFSNVSESVPDGVQSALWNFYLQVTGDLHRAPPFFNPEATTEAMVVSRYQDSFYYFTDSRSKHRGIEVAAYETEIQKAFANRSRLWRVSAITPSCPGVLTPPGEARKRLGESYYAKLVQETGGVLLDQKCTLVPKEWMATWASSIAFQAHLNRRRVFKLDETPLDSNHIDVSVGGMSLGRDAWSVDVEKRTLKVDWSKVDRRNFSARDKLEVRYPAAME
jgi:hypothetical protein